MQKLSTSDKVYVGMSKIQNAGRGVFAKSNINKNDIIESCPIIEMPKHDVSTLNKSSLVTYFFYFGKDKERLAVTLGFGSLYNHSYKPNATFKIKGAKGLIDFVALNDIKKDTEITFNYRHGNKNKSPLWFEV